MTVYKLPVWTEAEAAERAATAAAHAWAEARHLDLLACKAHKAATAKAYAAATAAYEAMTEVLKLTRKE